MAILLHYYSVSTIVFYYYAISKNDVVTAKMGNRAVKSQGNVKKFHTAWRLVTLFHMQLAYFCLAQTWH